ncbi:MAG: excalibur calcium-binding domain-containing protein [Pseudomonadota bacterium]
MIVRLCLFGLGAGVSVVLFWPAVANGCEAKQTCGQMRDCAEALHYLKECNVGRLDRDGDGIPCEKLCGKDQETLQRRVGARTGQNLLLDARSCGTKQTCLEMDSCAEARFHLSECGQNSLDRDGNGIPCEGLCR